MSRDKMVALTGATSPATIAVINNCGDGDVYTRVDQYQDWLQSIVDLKLH